MRNRISIRRILHMGTVCVGWRRPVLGRERYRRKAVECVRVVERMSDPAERAKLLEIARAYMSLSRHVSDRHEYDPEHHPKNP